MKVKVKTLDQRDREFELSDDATLGVLRTSIEEEMGIPQARQRLIFQARPLMYNERLLKDYGIVDGYTVHLVERPPDNFIPPGAESGRSGGTNESRRRRITVLSGEMTVVRNALFQDSNVTAGYVREALTDALGAVGESISSGLEILENRPRNGDLTLRVHVRGDSVRRIDSGALSRIKLIMEGLKRNEHTLEILEREPFRSLSIEGFERVVPPLRDDFDRAQFGEIVLQLEEVLYISRGELLRQNQADLSELQEEGASQTPNASLNSEQQMTVLRNAAPDDLANLLSRITAVQNSVNDHIKRYQAIIRRRALIPNSRARYIALCYEENLRRVLHRLAHAYHSISDLSVNFTELQSPLRPSFPDRRDGSANEIVLTLIFVVQHEPNEQTGSNTQRTQQSENNYSDRINEVIGQARALRLAHRMRTGMQSNSNVSPAAAVFTVPSLSGMGFRMSMGYPGMGAAPVHVHNARLHVAPSAQSGVRMETSGTAGPSASGRGSTSANSQPYSAASTSANNPAEFGAATITPNEADNDSIQNFLRNIVSNALGEVMIAQPGQTGIMTPRIQSSTALGASRRPLLEIHNISNRGNVQPNIVEPPGPSFHAPYGPVVGQLFLRSNGPGNAEAAQALSAVMQAATAAINENGVHVEVNGMPQTPVPQEFNRGIIWARRTYNNRGGRVLEHPNDMFIGPLYPSSAVTYTNDPHLNCQSGLFNPRPNIRNTDAYDALLNDLYQATQRYKETLDPTSSIAEDVENLVQRWNQIRGRDEPHGHVALNYRGDVVFDNVDHFKSVLITMLRRAIGNLAEADVDLAFALSASQGEYDTANYAMVPLVDFPMNWFDVPNSRITSVDLDATYNNTMESANASMDENRSTFDNFQGSSSSENQAFEFDAEARHENGPHLVDMVRSVSNVVQTGRCSTLAQVMRELGQPVCGLDPGFVNLVMHVAYEILQIPEIVHILHGDYSPLNNNRQQIRRFLIQNVFHDNCRPSAEDIRSASERVILKQDTLESFMQNNGARRFVNVDGIGRIDILASMLRLEQRIMEQFLRHLMEIDGSATEDFGKKTIDMIKSYVYRAATLANMSLDIGPQNYENLLLRFLQRETRREESNLLYYMVQLTMTHLRLVLQQEINFTVNDMMEDIVLATENEEVQSSSAAENVMEPRAIVDESDMDKKIEEKGSDNVESEEKCNDKASHGWISVLPKNWLPVIEDDKNRSVPNSAKSFSHAYSSGRSSSEKKGMNVVVEGSHHAVVSSAVRRTVEEAVCSAGFSITEIPNIPETNEVLQNEFDRLLRERIANDPEFDPAKYPELKKFMENGDR